MCVACGKSHSSSEGSWQNENALTPEERSFLGNTTVSNEEMSRSEPSVAVKAFRKDAECAKEVRAARRALFLSNSEGADYNAKQGDL